MANLEDLYKESRLGSEIDTNSLLETYGLKPLNSVSLTEDMPSSKLGHRTALLCSDAAWMHVGHLATSLAKDITPNEEMLLNDLELPTIIDSPFAESVDKNVEIDHQYPDVFDLNASDDTKSEQIVELENQEYIGEIKETNLEHSTDAEIQSFENTTESVLITKSKKSRKNKGKKRSFNLKDFSGLSSYSQWLLSLNDPDFEAKKEKADEKARKRKLEADAMKSVQKSQDIISESLAVILANQGHIDDAKKMYTQLMHKFPEKSSYFASKIENL